jgi:hypothetical protein
MEAGLYAVVHVAFGALAGWALQQLVEANRRGKFMLGDWVLWAATIGAIFWFADFVGGYVRRGEDIASSIKGISVVGALVSFAVSFLIAKGRRQGGGSSK